jgi:predicted RNA-binding protein with PUA-like domain
MNYWLVKQEPADYAWPAFLKEKTVAWTGVRNFAARNHLRAMQPHDLVLFYHSGQEKQVVGLARVRQAAYPDPTASEEGWVCVDLEAVKALAQPVTLAQIKAHPKLKDLILVKQPRLSVLPLAPAEFAELLRLSGTRV